VPVWGAPGWVGPPHLFGRLLVRPHPDAVGGGPEWGPVMCRYRDPDEVVGPRRLALGADPSRGLGSRSAAGGRVVRWIGCVELVVACGRWSRPGGVYVVAGGHRGPIPVERIAAVLDARGGRRWVYVLSYVVPDSVLPGPGRLSVGDCSYHTTVLDVCSGPGPPGREAVTHPTCRPGPGPLRPRCG